MLLWLPIFCFFSYFLSPVIITTISKSNSMAFTCLNLVPLQLNRSFYLYQMNHQNRLTFRITSEKFNHLGFQSLYLKIFQIIASLLQMRLFIQRVCLEIEENSILDHIFKGLLWIALRFGLERSYLDARCWTLEDELADFNIHYEIQMNRNLKFNQNFNILNLKFFHYKLLILKKNEIFLHFLYPYLILIN